MNKSDIEIIDPEDLVIRNGDTKEFVYKIRNLTDHEICNIDLDFYGNYLTLKDRPVSLKPHEEKEIIVVASVPEDWDEEIGLRPHFFGQTTKVIK